MPRKRRKPVEHLVMQPTMGKMVAPFEVHARESPEYIDYTLKHSEKAAEDAKVNLRIARSSGKSMVSFSGVSQKAWDRIFKKGKGGEKKGK